MTGDHDGGVDVVVIGAGPAGEVAAGRLAQAGLSTVIVEAGAAGGECSYTACIPSKAMLRGPIALDGVLHVEGASQVAGSSVDAAATIARRDRFTEGGDDAGQVRWLDGQGVELVRGHGRLAGERVVEVTDSDGNVRALEPRHAVIVAVGTDPNVPPIEGLAEADAWTNRESMRAEDPPASLVVLGAGPAGCEQALVWRALGADPVVVVERSDRPLARMEPFVGEAVQAGMEERGIEVRTGVVAVAVERPEPGGSVRVRLAPVEGAATDRDHTAPTEVLEAAELLVSLGRVPLTGDLGLESVGLAPGETIEVADDGSVVGVEGRWLYAVGDVTGEALLTHMGKYQARACSDAIVARAEGREVSGEPWSRTCATAQDAGPPQVIYTLPEVAAVGLTEAEAVRRGLKVRTAEYEIGDVSGAALHADGYEGHAKLVIDDERDVVVGATFVGPDVGELVHSATVAVVGEVPIDRLWHAVPSFPTISEVWLRLLEADEAARTGRSPV